MKLLNTYRDPAWVCVEATWKPKQYVRYWFEANIGLVFSNILIQASPAKTPVTKLTAPVR